MQYHHDKTALLSRFVLVKNDCVDISNSNAPPNVEP